jgi:hypothetical protein
MSWIEAVLRAIAAQAHLPYGRSKEGSDVVEGATEQMDWRGEKILRKGDHVSCVYTVYETMMTAAKMLGFEDDITTEEIEELKRWCFVYGDEYREGIGGGLEATGLGSIIDVKDARAGDVAQIWDTTDGKVVFGHCVIILGEEEGTKYPAFSTWSAEPNEGNVRSWRYIQQTNSSKLREWIVGRPGF